jgi:hypothetical protein
MTVRKAVDQVSSETQYDSGLYGHAMPVMGREVSPTTARFGTERSSKGCFVYKGMSWSCSNTSVRGAGDGFISKPLNLFQANSSTFYCGMSAVTTSLLHLFELRMYYIEFVCIYYG